MVLSGSLPLRPVSRRKSAKRKHFVGFCAIIECMRTAHIRPVLLFALVLGGFLCGARSARAASIGMHVLNPSEFSQVEEAFRPLRQDGEPLYITVPFTLDDLNRLPEWQKAFDLAQEKNIVPLVRLSTRYNPEKDAWEVPTQKNIVDEAKALSSLRWPQTKRHVIFFNETNHAKEWGGSIDPHSFAEMTLFALDWFGTEQAEYVLLPAAMDLAAPDGKSTKEAFGYWREVLGSKPEILDKISAWNSHSYPNPGFSSSPRDTGKNRLDGFKHELAFLKKFTDRELSVYITETGWQRTSVLDKRLASYYSQALKGVWSDPAVVAVTPFIFAGSPGPFSGFSFRDESGKPTVHWTAFERALSGASLLTDRSVLQ